eukprot:sb/3463755/
MSQKVSREVKMLSKELRNTDAETWKDALGINEIYNRLNYRCYHLSARCYQPTAPFFSMYRCRVPREWHQPPKSRVLVAGFLSLLSSLSRRETVVNQMRELGFEKEVLDAVLERAQDTRNNNNNEVIYSDVDWRLDVILSNESLGKVLQPEVQMKISLSDGETLDLQLSQQEFHALRQSTARTLFELCQLKERNPINANVNCPNPLGYPFKELISHVGMPVTTGVIGVVLPEAERDKYTRYLVSRLLVKQCYLKILSMPQNFTMKLIKVCYFLCRQAPPTRAPLPLSMEMNTDISERAPNSYSNQDISTMLERIPDTSNNKNDEVVYSDVDWRLDVILSNESLGKVLQPEVNRGHTPPLPDSTPDNTCSNEDFIVGWGDNGPPTVPTRVPRSPSIYRPNTIRVVPAERKEVYATLSNFMIGECGVWNFMIQCEPGMELLSEGEREVQASSGKLGFRYILSGAADPISAHCFFENQMGYGAAMQGISGSDCVTIHGREVLLLKARWEKNSYKMKETVSHQTDQRGRGCNFLPDH